MSTSECSEYVRIQNRINGNNQIIANLEIVLKNYREIPAAVALEKAAALTAYTAAGVECSAAAVIANKVGATKAQIAFAAAAGVAFANAKKKLDDLVNEERKALSDVKNAEKNLQDAKIKLNEAIKTLSSHRSSCKICNN
jgi:hypothetical protein